MKIYIKKKEGGIEKQSPTLRTHGVYMQQNGIIAVAPHPPA